jgi:hypothetical protein
MQSRREDRLKRREERLSRKKRDSFDNKSADN